MKRRELILLLTFAGVGLLVLSAKLWEEFARRTGELSEREHALEMQQAEAEVYLERRDLWMNRLEWLTAHQPLLGPADQVDNELVNLARAPAVGEVTTERLELLDPVETSSYRQAGIEFTAKGKLADVFAWLHSLQAPENFRAIRRLKVNPDQNAPDKVVCEVQLLRWYAPR